MGQLTVRTMSKLSGVSAHTLRAWEKRYGALRPARTEGGQRAYNMMDLKRLRLLKRLTEAGYSIGQIARLEDLELQNLLKSLTKDRSSHTLPAGGFARHQSERLQIQSTQNPLAHTLEEPEAEADRGVVEAIVTDIAEFRLEEVYRSLTATRMRYSSRDFCLRVIAPILREVGVLVEAGSMSVAQEHAFSALLRDQLGSLIQSFKVNGTKDSVVFATSEGDLHEFGILMGQIFCLGHGLKAHALGSNLPLESLIFAVKALNADHLVLSFAELSLESYKVSPAAYLKGLRKSLPPKLNIFVGGGGVTQQILEEVGAQILYVESLEELDRVFERMTLHS